MRSAIVQQFGKPTGLLGEVAGLIMAVRPSNRERNRRTLEFLQIRSDDNVLELGFGPGLAVELASRLAPAGRVIGIEHSPLMLRRASCRNAKAIAAGRVQLLLGSAEGLPDFPVGFDKVFAVNVHMFWKDPVAVLLGVRKTMKPAGRIALTFQPRARGATAEHAQSEAQRMAGYLREAGFHGARVNLFKMKPVDAACVVAWHEEGG